MTENEFHKRITYSKSTFLEHAKTIFGKFGFLTGRQSDFQIEYLEKYFKYRPFWRQKEPFVLFGVITSSIPTTSSNSGGVMAILL